MQTFSQMRNEQRFRNSGIHVDKMVLGKVADLLNMDLFCLSSWSWLEEGVPVKMRRHLNGKYQIFMDENII